MIKYYHFVDELVSEIMSMTDIPIEVGDRDNDPPTMILFPLDNVWWFFQMDDSFTEANMMFQLTCVGVSWQQSVWLCEQAMDVILSIETENIKRIRPHTTPQPQLDDAVTPPVWFAPTRWWATVSYH